MNKLTLLFLIATLAVPVQAVASEPKGVWEFNQPDPNRATIGEPLELVGTVEGVPGVNAADGAIQIGEGSYYICRHGIEPNGGGAKVNHWTLLMDFSYPRRRFGLDNQLIRRNWNRCRRLLQRVRLHHPRQYLVPDGPRR